MFVEHVTRKKIGSDTSVKPVLHFVANVLQLASYELHFGRVCNFGSRFLAFAKIPSQAALSSY